MVDFSVPMQGESPLAAMNAAATANLTQQQAAGAGMQNQLTALRLNALQGVLGSQGGAPGPAGGASGLPGGISPAALQQLAIVDPASAGQILSLQARIRFQQTGDPSALMVDPAAYEQVATAHGKMTDAQKTQFNLSADAVGRAAQSVSMIRPGPERTSEWNSQLSSLYQGGYIQADALKRFYNNPSDLVLQQARSLSMANKDWMSATGETAGKEAAARLPYTPLTVPEGGTEFLGTQPLATAGKQVTGVTSQGTPYQTFTTPPLKMYNGQAGYGAPVNALSPAGPGGAAGAGGPGATAGGAAAPGGPTPPPAAGAATPNGVPAGAVQTGLNPAAQEEQAGLGKQYAEFSKNLQDRADSALKQNAIINQARQESTTWTPNKFADWSADARNFGVSMAQSLGLDPGKYDQPLSDFQAFNKNMGQLVRESTKEMGSRIAAQEVQWIQNTMPNATMQQGALTQIFDQLQGMNNYAIATNDAAAQWRAGPGNGSIGSGPQPGMTFQRWWQGNLTPAAFIVAQMQPQDRAAFIERANATPQGRTYLGNITKELRFAKAQGVFQ